MPTKCLKMPQKCHKMPLAVLLSMNTCFSLPCMTQQMKGNNPICVALSEEARANTSSVILLGIYSLQTLLFFKSTHKNAQNASKCLKMPTKCYTFNCIYLLFLPCMTQQQKKTILFVLRHPRKPD